MAIEDLIAVSPPPVEPNVTEDGKRWNEIERQLGIRLPSDFREFGKCYGTGRFMDQDRIGIYVLNGFSSDYLKCIDVGCQRLRLAREQIGPSYVPYPVFPEKGGLLPWGKDDNGAKMYWLTDGEPNVWPTLVTPPRYSDYQRFDLTMTSFLAKAFRREITPVIWDAPEFFRGSGVIFNGSSVDNCEPQGIRGFPVPRASL